MPGTSLAQPERQLLLRRSLDARLKEMRDHARRATAERQAERAAAQELQRTIAENPTLANAGASEHTFYVIMLLTLPTVYFTDVMLLGPVAEYLAEAGFSEDHLIVRYAPYLVPFLIITLESVVGAFRVAKYREYLAGDCGAGAHRVLTVLAALIGLFIPAAGVALYLNEEAAPPTSSVEAAVVYLPIALPLVLSLACHLCILLGAKYMHDAKTWLSVSRTCTKLRAEQAKRREAFTGAATAAADVFPAYLRDLDDYNNVFRPQLGAGPFDDNTRTIVNEIYGYEVIGGGANRRPAAQPVPPTPPPTPVPNGGAAQGSAGGGATDDPDWEALYALQRRDDESEVRA